MNEAKPSCGWNDATPYRPPEPPLAPETGSARVCPVCRRRQFADRCAFCTDEPRLGVEIACPFCLGGHFKPCQICGDSGSALFVPMPNNKVSDPAP